MNKEIYKAKMITDSDLKFREEKNVKRNGKIFDRVAIAYVPLSKEETEVVVAVTFFEGETLEEVFKDERFRKEIVNKMNLALQELSRLAC